MVLLGLDDSAFCVSLLYALMGARGFRVPSSGCVSVVSGFPVLGERELAGRNAIQCFILCDLHQYGYVRPTYYCNSYPVPRCANRCRILKYLQQRQRQTRNLPHHAAAPCQRTQVLRHVYPWVLHPLSHCQCQWLRRYVFEILVF